MQATATIYAPGVVTLTGDIVSQSDGSVTVRYKKPRSSKFLVQTLPMSSVIGIHAGTDGELDSAVLYRNDRVEQYTVSGEVGEDEAGNITITDENDDTLTIPAGTDVEIIGEADEEAPKKAGKGAKAEKAKEGKKAKSEEASDEKPAKKDKKAKDEEPAEESKKKDKKKDKGDKKAKVEDDDGKW